MAKPRKEGKKSTTIWITWETKEMLRKLATSPKESDGAVLKRVLTRFMSMLDTRPVQI